MLRLQFTDGPEHRVENTAQGLCLDGEFVPDARIERLNPHRAVLHLHGRTHEAALVGWWPEKGLLRLRLNGKLMDLQAETLEDRLLKVLGLERSSSSRVAELKAPMPGLVRRVDVAPQQPVAAGDPLLVLEAMKMENVLKAPADAIVAQVLVAPGDAVQKNQVLLRFA